MRLTATLLVLVLSVTTAAAETVTYENETEPFPGVRVLERHTSGPSWRIHAAFISLCADGVRIDARSSQASRITAAAWGSAMGADVAVNGDFYRTDRSTPTIYGDAVGVGLRWPTARTGLASEFSDDWYYRKYGWIAFGDGWVELNHSKWAKNNLTVGTGWHVGAMTKKIPEGTHALVSGFPELVVEGIALSSFPDRGDMADRHPRTAMGLSKDRKTFILVVVDGRSTQSVGMNGAELAALMHELGAWTAFNLDGGGSSQMWLRGQGTVNAPSDGSPRAVANHWGVFAAGTGAPGSCFRAGGCFPSPLPGAVGSRFADLADDASGADAASLVVDRALLPMCSESPAEMFCPSCTLTRRDALVLIARAAGLDTSSAPASPTFADVPSDAPGFAEIEAAAAAGITNGCGDGAFCPDAAVTRGAFAAFLARARGWTAPPDAPTYADVPADHALASDIGAYAARCVDDGCGDGNFCPDKSLLRKRGAVLAVRGFNLDGSNPCADEQPGGAQPDGGADPEPEPDGSGGCNSSRGEPGWLVILVMSAALARRRYATHTRDNPA